MALVEIARSEITVLNAVIQMRSKRQQQNERRRLQSQVPEPPGLHKGPATRNCK
jgi:hypothetical protein